MGLPAPPWLLLALLVLTFVLHLFAMNFLVGGVAMLVVGLKKAPNSPFHAKLTQVLAKALPPTMAMTITLGIAPLLFLQVLYGQAFYTSSVLMAWGWLAVIPMLLLAYYGLYVVHFRPEWLGRAAQPVAWISGLFIFLVGMMFTSNSTLLLEPQRWADIYGQSPLGLTLNMGTNGAWARYLHTIVGGLAVGGLGVAALAGVHRKSDPEWAEKARDYGVKWFTGITILNLLVGFWFLFSIPKEIRMLFLGEGQAETAVLWLGVVASLAAMHFARKSPWLGLALITVTVALMAVARQMLRDLLLRPSVDIFTMKVNPQWDVFAIFAVLLLVGLVAVYWMLRQFAKGAVQDG